MHGGVGHTNPTVFFTLSWHNCPVITRLRVALQSPDGWRRLLHYVYGKALFSLPPGLRRRLFRGDQVTCPLCGSSLRGFLRLYRPYHRMCPVCGSLQRQRLVWLLLQEQGILAGLRGKKMLHFAPEACLEAQFRRIPGLEYLSADLYSKQAMRKIDITHIPLPDDSFDFVYCSHVLEHVQDDRQALAELQRVLRPGGQALILVPVKGESTIEDATLTDPLEREQRFGQFDHLRIYGMDFVERMEAAGFSVRVWRQADLQLGEAELRRMELHAPDMVFEGRKGSSTDLR